MGHFEMSHASTGRSYARNLIVSQLMLSDAIAIAAVI